MSIDRPSYQFEMSVVMSGKSEPKVVNHLQVVRVARERTATSRGNLAVRMPSKTEDTVCAHGHGLGS